MDPREAVDSNYVFDPQTVGLKGPMAMEFRRSLNRDKAQPRERHQFPETRGQEIGWCMTMSRGAPAKERSEPAGSNPSKLGIGWLQKDGHGGPTTKLAAASGSIERELPPYEEKPKPRKSKDGNVREEFGVPPYGTSCGSLERAEVRKLTRQMQRED